MKRSLSVLIALSLFLAACGGEDTQPIIPPDDGGNDGGSGAGFAGTVGAPPGGDVFGTFVIACFLEAGQCNSNSPNTVGVQINTSGAAANFSLPTVAPGTYILVAQKDVGPNNAYGDAGDYLGFYTLDGQSQAQVSPPTGGLYIQMSAIGGGAPPPPPPTSLDLSGTVTAPPGGDVAQTEVVACFLEAGQNECNVQSPNTKSVIISTAGQAGSFSITGLAAGQYLVVAFKDNSVGCDGTYPSCNAVTPPQTGLSIQLVQDTSTPPDTGGAGTISGTLVFPGSLGETSSGVRPKGALTQEVRDQLAQIEVKPAPRTPSRRLIPGEVIVKFKAEKTQAQQTLSVQGLSLQRSQAAGLPRTALYRAPGLDEQGTLALIRELNARPDVAYAEANTVRSIMKTPNDPFYPLQWHYEAMNLPAAWDINDGTEGDVTVAVVDTGAIDHPDLQNIWLGGYDFVSDPINGADGDGYDADPTDLGRDSGYHGSHVAGTVAASTDNGSGVAGVSWGARVVPMRVLGVTGSGSNLDIVNGVLWAAGEPVAGVPTNPNPADIINLSLGGEGFCSQTEQEAFDRVRAKGITVVVAAGNENVDASGSAPANCDGVIAVGATGPRGERAPYSNYGATVDLMAPGGDSSQTLTIGGETVPAGVLSTIGDGAGGYIYAAYDGTSMATPHVAGLVALMLAQEPDLDPDTVLARLQSSAVPLSDAECGQTNGCGAGLVDAAAALGSTDTTDPTQPPPVTGSAPTYVAALYCLAACSSADENLSSLVTVPTDALQIPFQISDLVPGTYVVAGWQDLDNDEVIDEGEPFGRHLNNLTLAAGQSLDRADIYLAPFRAQGASSEMAALFERSALRTRQPFSDVTAKLDVVTLPESALEGLERFLKGLD